MPYLVFDIETAPLPFEEFDDAQREYLTRGATTEEERQEKIKLLSLNPLTARVVALGMLHVRTLEDEPKGHIYSNHGPGGTSEEGTLSDGSQWKSMSEEELFRKWWNVLDAARSGGGRYGDQSLHLITFNGRSFDCPFMMLRSAVLRVRPSRNLMDGTRYNTPGQTDLAEELNFRGFDRNGAMRRFNLDFYCKTFGIHSPKAAGVTGYDVPDLFRDGKHRDIAEYCMRDVHATWDLFKVWKEYLAWN